MTAPDSQSTQPNDLLIQLMRRWKTLALATSIGTAIAITYGLIATPWYRATLTVIPSQKSRDASNLGLVAKLPGGIDPFSTDVQRIQAVLHSVSVTDAVIDKFDLMRRYNVRFREQAREQVWKHCETALDRQSSIVSLSCEDTVPQRAQEMTSYFGQVGNEVFGRVSASSAREERRFLETQVTKARADVEEVSRKLREFQEKNRVVDLPEQSKAVISAMASLKGELLSKQLELSYLTSFSSRTEASVMQLQQQINIMENKLNQLEDAESIARGSASKPSEGSGSASFFPDALSVPALRFELEQLMREQKIQETVFSMLTQRYEMARVDEARDTSTFQILDSPTLPTMKSRPRRTKLAIYGFFLGAMTAFAWVLVPGWWRRRTGALRQ